MASICSRLFQILMLCTLCVLGMCVCTQDEDEECGFGVTPYATPFGTPASSAKMNRTHPQTPSPLKESRDKASKRLFK